MRQNVTETQTGVSLVLDVQVLDMDTCDPIDGAYVEIWRECFINPLFLWPPICRRNVLLGTSLLYLSQLPCNTKSELIRSRHPDCNATGVYSGVSASGNGNSATVTSNLNATFLRGVQETDSDGVIRFDTIVPGFYTGRTAHIHVMVHLDATPLANGTLMDTTAAHVGQIFFDQDLQSEVYALTPYTSNTQTQTTNSEDSILAQEAATSDPFLEYVLLGDTLSDGLLGWLSFGINTTLSSTVSAAATLYATGGETNSNSGSSGGGPGGF